MFAPDQVVVAGILAAFSVVIGHNFPVWLGFKGGKGIATSAGIMIALFPLWVFLFALVVWVALFYGTRYVSVASILRRYQSAGLKCCSRSLDAAIGAGVLAALMCALAVWRHKSNIERLLAGTEKKFEKKRSTSRA